MAAVSTLVRRLAGSAPVGHLLRRMAGERAAVLMYHRFSGEQATPPAALRSALAYLRRHRYPILDLAALLDAAAAGGSIPAGAVAITVDDGHADFAAVAQPIFAEFDAPVTLFVTTGAVDGTCWFWWDRVALAVRRTRAPGVRVSRDGAELRASWAEGPDARRARTAELCERLKRVPTPTREALVEDLVRALDVDLPARPPAEDAVMSWDDVRRCEAAGVAIGAHTVTHPILARCDDARAEWEVAESLRRLRAECRGPIAVFAYPNGQPADYGPREFAALEASGVAWAVTTSPGYIAPAAVRGADPRARYALPRFTDPGGAAALARAASGVGA